MCTLNYVVAYDGGKPCTPQQAEEDWMGTGESGPPEEVAAPYTCIYLHTYIYVIIYSYMYIYIDI